MRHAAAVRRRLIFSQNLEGGGGAYASPLTPPPRFAIPVMPTVHYNSIRYAIQYRTACCLTMSMLDARIMGLLIEMK